MNECLGISQDKDVRRIETRVDKAVLERYYAGEELEPDERPRAKPMLLDYDGGKRSEWNREVWEAFKPVLLQAESELDSRKAIPFPDENFARMLFMGRVARLRGYIREMKARTLYSGKKETTTQVQERLRQIDEYRRDESRDNTRRAEVFISSV